MSNNLALIGCGYWGRNYVNTLRDIPSANLRYVVDLKKPNLALAEGTTFTTSLDQALGDPELDAVMIVTPTNNHYATALKAIRAGKNVMIEKPITTTHREAVELCDQADKAGVQLMVGHIFKFNNAVKYIKQKLDAGDIGRLRYIESRRVGLGPIRQDVSVLWDFAAHDIYIAQYMTGQMPSSVACSGQTHNRKHDDIASLNMRFPNDVFVSVYVNWEHPIKERQTIFGGDKKAISFNDMQPSEKVWIYERGVNYLEGSDDFGSFQATTREGDIAIPRVDVRPPLAEELKHFLAVINGQEKCFADGREGASTVKILEAAEESRRKGGLEVRLA